MPKAYSEDLCEKVMTAIELDGMPITEASELFNVARSSIYRWKQRKQETGSLKAKKNKGATGIIKDWDEFEKFIEAHRDKTQEEMAKLWSEPISARSISRALKKIGFTGKKRPMAIEKGMKKHGRNLSKRGEKLEQPI